MRFVTSARTVGRGKLAMATPDGQISPGIGHRQTGALAGPSARRERPFTGAGGNVMTAKLAAACDERRDEHTGGQS
jgi:hypothetical protein